jgi:peptidoglycan hydrolase-like protein with peptidoglycan-binding domain
MNKAISQFLLTFKHSGLGLRAFWQLPLGVLVSLILVSTACATQVHAQSATGGVLQPADQGEAVLDLQQRLSELGYYSGPVTGYFDTTTQEAVSRFQQENGLTPDGIVGAATGSALYQGGASYPDSASAAASGTLQINDGGASVTELQQQLAQLGYYTGSVTGVFDQQTQSAVMSFQRDRGLSPDGIVGNATQSALYQSPTTTSTGVAYTASASATSETPNNGLLQLGAVGSEVSTLQSQLQALGYYDGPISGSFGSQTQAALIAFQQSQGLTADGIAGPRVNAALTTASPTVAAAPQSSVQPTVTATAPATITATPTPTTAPQITTTTVAPAVMQPQPTAANSGIVQVPPVAPTVAPTTVLPPPSPQAQPVAIQPSGNPGNPPVMRSNLESGRFSITELQRRLQMRGFDLGGDMSGVYDSTTQDAIMQAQQSYGISPSDLGE